MEEKGLSILVSNRHPEYRHEQEYLDFTLDKVEATLSRIETNRHKHEETIKQAMIDLDFLDSSLSYSTILSTSELLKVDSENYHKLLLAKRKPYFSRIDFKECSGERKKYYIGKMTLVDDHKEPIIIDWRSPIASVYYEGQLGQVVYQTPVQEVRGELHLKRQFTIEDGKLLHFMDIDITANDAFLQASLAAHADNRLKDIASTIQAEQNRVIRAGLDGPLIVQGVAGSGKTTIALHRVAYLIYTYQDRFIPENFVIITPNRLFMKYISDVLPELGVERIKQTTFADLVFELMGFKFKLKNPNQKLAVLLDKKTGSQKQFLLKQLSMFKGSLAFKDLIDQYIADLEDQLLPDTDLSFKNHMICSKSEIRQLFIKEFYFLPVFKRIEALKKVLANKLKTNKSQIIEKIEEKYSRELLRRRKIAEQSDDPASKQNVVDCLNERDQKIQAFKNAAKTLVKNYLRQIPRRQLISYYQDILAVANLEQATTESLDINILTFLSKYSLELLVKQEVEIEDLAPLVYMQAKLFGFSEKIAIDHIVMKPKTSVYSSSIC